MFEFDPKNNQFHQDLDLDVETLDSGLLTFTVRINNGVVSDYILIKYDKKLGVPQTDRDGHQGS